MNIFGAREYVRPAGRPWNACTGSCSQGDACTCRPAPAEASSEIQESEAIASKRAKRLDRADYLFGFLFVLLACVACGAVIAALP